MPDFLLLVGLKPRIYFRIPFKFYRRSIGPLTIEITAVNFRPTGKEKGKGVMQKVLIYTGIALIVLGLLWPYISKIPFGHLPGDIIINKPSFKLYFPLTTMILISAIISLIIWLFRR